MNIKVEHLTALVKFLLSHVSEFWSFLKEDGSSKPMYQISNKLLYWAQLVTHNLKCALQIAK